MIKLIILVLLLGLSFSIGSCITNLYGQNTENYKCMRDTLKGYLIYVEEDLFFVNSLSLNTNQKTIVDTLDFYKDGFLLGRTLSLKDENKLRKPSIKVNCNSINVLEDDFYLLEAYFSHMKPEMNCIEVGFENISDLKIYPVEFTYIKPTLEEKKRMARIILIGCKRFSIVYSDMRIRVLNIRQIRADVKLSFKPFDKGIHPQEPKD